MNWLPPFSKLRRSKKTVKEREVAEREGKEEGEEPNHTTTRQPGPL
jgi:hypothetical protein